jgi:hypothetical protein
MSITFSTLAGEVNFSNSNALLLQRAMGLEPDYCGQMPAAEFNRAAWAAWTLDDLALARFVRPKRIEQGAGGAVLYDCALDLSDIRARLLRLATELGAEGTVSWG